MTLNTSKDTKNNRAAEKTASSSLEFPKVRAAVAKVLAGVIGITCLLQVSKKLDLSDSGTKESVSSNVNPKNVRQLTTFEGMALQMFLREKTGHKMGVDGILGPQTASAFETFLNQDLGSLSYTLGDQNPLIAFTQGILKHNAFFNYPEVTGYFGEVTQNALMAFQSERGLQADGVLDVKTLAELLKTMIDPTHNFYFRHIAWEQCKDNPSKGGGYCGQAVSNLCKLFPDERVQKIADVNAVDQNGKPFYPEGKRHAVRMQGFLDAESQRPGSGWVKMPVKSFADVPEGAIICYPPKYGSKAVCASKKGFELGIESDGSGKYGHIAVMVTINGERRELYDLNTTKFGGRASTLERFNELMKNGEAFVYCFVGNFQSWNDRAIALRKHINVDQVKFDHELLAEFEGKYRTVAYTLPVKRFPNSGVTVSTGVDLGQWKLSELVALGIPESLLKKVEPYMGLKGAKAEAFLQKNPLVVSQDEAKVLYAAAFKSIMTRFGNIYEFHRDLSQPIFTDLPAELVTIYGSLAYHMGPGYCYVKSQTPTEHELWKQDLAEAIFTGSYMSVVEKLLCTTEPDPSLRMRRHKECAVVAHYLYENDPANFESNFSGFCSTNRAQAKEFLSTTLSWSTTNSRFSSDFLSELKKIQTIINPKVETVPIAGDGEDFYYLADGSSKSKLGS